MHRGFTLQATFEGVWGVRGGRAGPGSCEQPSRVEAPGARGLGVGVSTHPLQYRLPVGIATAVE